MYHYFIVRGGPQYDVAADASVVCSFLVERSGFRLNSPCVYVRSEPSEWASVALATADSHGNYHTHEAGCAVTVNMVEVVCTTAGREAGRHLAEDIATLLGWGVHVDELV